MDNGYPQCPRLIERPFPIVIPPPTGDQSAARGTDGLTRAGRFRAPSPPVSSGRGETVTRIPEDYSRTPQREDQAVCLDESTIVAEHTRRVARRAGLEPTARETRYPPGPRPRPTAGETRYPPGPGPEPTAPDAHRLLTRDPAPDAVWCDPGAGV